MIFNKKAHLAGASFKDQPMGTGPFIIDKHEFRNVTRARKNPDYFVPGRPYLDSLELYWMPDDATKLSAYRTGQIDTLLGSGAYDTYYEQIMSTERGKTDVNVFQHNSGGQPNFAMNHRLSPWKDVRVRRGLSMALDRDAIVKARYSKGRWSMGLPTDWSARHFPPKGEEFGPYFQYNPKEAKAQLDQAAFPKDFEILVSSVTGAPDDQVVLAVEYWKQIGLNPTIKVVDSVAFNQRYNSKDFGIVYSGPITGGTDLDDFGFRMLHTGQVANIQGISDPDVDRITEKVQETFDRAPREKLGEDLLQRELDQVFRVWGASQFIQDFKRPYVQGGYISHDVYFFASGWGMYTFTDTWLDKA
jgi:peptide/nickel transport system substrate-binding protein